MSASLPTFGPGREFERIREFLGTNPDDATIRVGPGDDACVLSDGLVLATDLCLEGIHFRSEWISWEEAGGRAAAAGLSDLAAMGADPVGLLISLATPRDDGVGEAVMAGVRRVAGAGGALLLGGDLTRSPGPTLIDVVSVGRVGAPLVRSNARAGDELWVTGSLGGAAGAVAAWERTGSAPPGLRRAFAHPTPRIAEAKWLSAAGAHAAIDLSDGLAGDAAHLGAASGVEVEIEPAAVPVHPALEEAAATILKGIDPFELALHGGDDFELLVAAPAGALTARVDEFRERFHLSLSRIGRVTPGEGVSLADEGGRRRVGRGGYDHFEEGRNA